MWNKQAHNTDIIPVPVHVSVSSYCLTPPSQQFFSYILVTTLVE